MRMSCFAFALVIVSPTRTPAQVRDMKLPPAKGRIDPGLKVITSMRELSDGRLLVTDPRGKGLVAIDFNANDVKPVARKGRGPGEYSVALPLLALAEDSSLMADGLSNEWMLLDGARVLERFTPSEAIDRATSCDVNWTDARGFVYLLRDPPERGGKRRIGRGDSSYVVRVKRTSGKADTIARVRRQPMEVDVKLNSDGRVNSMRNRYPAMETGEAMTAFPDGWIAIARLDPYRVDWRSPDGEWVHGARLPFQAVAVTERERNFYRESIERATGDAFDQPYRLNEWPDVVPPYGVVPSAFFTVLPMSDGRVLIRRSPSVDHPESAYDIVDRKGSLNARLILQGNESILGVTSRHFYVLETNEDGGQWIRRHPWPALH
jgi:hypothetical protein